MNKDLEKQIEEAAYNNTESLMFSHNSLETKSMARRLDNSFITGAKSETSKQYWQQGMYSKQQLNEAIEAGINEGLRKQQQEMYSEEDLYEILNKFRKEFSLYRGIQIMDFDIKNFIEQNKKK